MVIKDIGTFKDIVNRSEQHDTIDEYLCDRFDFNKISTNIH